MFIGTCEDMSVCLLLLKITCVCTYRFCELPVALSSAVQLGRFVGIFFLTMLVHPFF